jgi:AcrR family transcriptional regulator
MQQMRYSTLKSSKATRRSRKQNGKAAVAVRPQKLSRAQRAALLREKILHCAAAVVGEYGYQDASIARITQLAGIAQGTFYLYFKTRQHLFDELLPHAGQEMMRYIGERLHGSKNFVEAEERGFRAFFDYMDENPGFYRLLNEAEFTAPIAHRKHFEQLIEHYLSSMRRGDEEKLRAFSDDQLKLVAYTMMAARSYIYLGYVKYGTSRKPPESVVKTYMKLVKSGFE